jgi:capsid protein
MLHWFGRLIRKAVAGRAARPHLRSTTFGLRSVQARYDAAVTNDDNRRHWAHADGLSANAANSAAVRQTLRNRSRYEVANNSYARGIVLTLANDVVGTGPRLQLLTSDGDANSRVERAFMGWARAVSLAEKLRTMRMARATDGEAFAILTSNPRLTTDIQLDVRLVEADQVTTPNVASTQLNNVDGIVFDAAGNPVEYHVLRQHPGGSFAGFNREFDAIPASAMIHWFRADRPGQARGIPDIMPALPLFAQLRRFTLAVLAAAETAADFAGILYTDAPAIRRICNGRSRCTTGTRRPACGRPTTATRDWR